MVGIPALTANKQAVRLLLLDLFLQFFQLVLRPATVTHCDTVLAGSEPIPHRRSDEHLPWDETDGCFVVVFVGGKLPHFIVLRLEHVQTG